MEIPVFPYARRIGLILAVCLSVACAATRAPVVTTIGPASAVAETPEPEIESLPEGVFHRVLPGQTLWRIARTYDVALERVIEANGIIDPSRIASGDMIWIPGAAEELDVAIVAPAPVPANGEWLWPVAGGTVLSGYGAPRRTHLHGGIDIRAPHGAAVVASRGGRVAYSGAGLSGYGMTVILDHGDGIQTLYAHNSALLVRPGDRVERGQSIARIGRTGNATADHCHFEIRVNERRVDPLPWLGDDRRASR